MLGNKVARNRIAAAGLVVFASGCASIPLLVKYKNGERNLTTSATPLAGGAIMRGAYWNHGSRDIGPDPDWDMRTGTWNGNSKYHENSYNDNDSSSSSSSSGDSSSSSHHQEGGSGGATTSRNASSSSSSSSALPLPPSMLFNPTPQQVQEHRQALEKRLRDAGLRPGGGGTKKEKDGNGERVATTEVVR